MTSINDILNNLGVEDAAAGQEKIASSASNSVSEAEVKAQAEKLGLIDGDGQTKVASQTRGDENMDLQDFYDMHFGAPTEKVASSQKSAPAAKAGNDEGLSKEASAALEKAGSIAGAAFSNALENRLMDFVIKTAMDDNQPDSKATQDAQAGAGVVPSGNVVNDGVALPVNRPSDADQAIDTSPEYYDLLDAAIEKKKLEAAIAEGKAGDLSHKTVSVASGLETPSSQADA